MEKTAFRNPYYAGDGEVKAFEVMSFEILELGNTDILYTLLENGLIQDQLLLESISSVANYIEDFGGPGYYVEDHTCEDVIHNILKEIKRVTGKDIRVALWLASKEAIIKYYDGSENNIIEYPTSDVVLSDLGEQGSLFGYESMPRPVLKED